MRKVAAIIPCRMASTRLPGKPLADIHGRPMIEWVYRSALAAGCFNEGVWIASADKEILSASACFGAPTILTSGRHATGTDCVAEASSSLDADIVVNVQGDEPMIEPAILGEMTARLVKSYGFWEACGTFTPVTDIAAVLDMNRVKVVLAINGSALILSRFPIPYPKQARPDYLTQLGLSAFTPTALKGFASMKPGPLEQAEGIELLRVLEHGDRLSMMKLDSRSQPVDTAEDLARVREIMSEKLAA